MVRNYGGVVHCLESKYSWTKKMHLYAGFKNIEKRTIGEKRTFVIKYRNSGYHQPQHRKLFLFDYHSSNMSMPPYSL